MRKGKKVVVRAGRVKPPRGSASRKQISGKAQEVESWILKQIKNGAFEKGRPLPGDLELVNRFGVARGTVRAAVSALQHQGLVVRRRGAGTFLSKRGERRSGVIGLLFPEIETCGYYQNVEAELFRFCKRIGYEIDVRRCSVDDEHDIAVEMRHSARELVTLPVEGVVFRPLINAKYAKVNQEIARIFENAKTPFVLFDSDIVKKPKRSSYDVIAVNNVDAGRRVAEYLIKSGRRRIAFNAVDCVEGKNENLDNRFFGVAGESIVRGVYDAVREISVNPSDAAALQRMFRSRWRPDAFVCVNDEIAVELVAALKGLGIRVPKDVAVVGFDDVACARQCVPPLTTVHQPSREIAQSLIKTLLFRTRSPDAPPQEIYLGAPLVCRGTA